MKIKDIRTTTGLSQSQFASLFGMSIKTLQAWEQGRQSPPEYVSNMIERILQLTKIPENFNPMYDSDFLVLRTGNSREALHLIEMHDDELVELRAQINATLARRGK